jgi:Zn-dependent protease
MVSLLPKIQMIAIAILPLIFAITLHEAAHGWIASKLGDKTALQLGRVTLNPIKHIDLVGTIIVPIVLFLLGGFVFGWAKPVPVNWSNLKNPRRDMAFVALAGPIANLFMALLWAVIAKITILILATNISSTSIKDILMFFLLAGEYGILINLVLMVLNLVPIPPLDGSRVVSALLPKKAAYQYGRIEPYGIWILIALLAFKILHLIIFPPIIILSHFIHYIFALPKIF